MKLGAEPKRLAILGALLLLAGYFLYTGVFRESASPPPAATGAAGRPVPRIDQVPDVGRPVPRAEARPRGERPSLQDFKPSLRPARVDEQADLNSAEATLRLDLLARVAGVKIESGNRSLFEFSAPPPPPEPKVIPAAKIQTVPPPPPAPERKPAAPPIPLKFFGYATSSRLVNRRGFFMDGDQILVGAEGEVLKKRYKVVKIGVNSVVMEDLEFKTEQTLRLEPQPG
ncbi:MAG: hypothetical protein IT159_09850 [Bryobacterales bacterium]|nr:hypothetical protein [Bryobacterales bacterium]